MVVSTWDPTHPKTRNTIIVWSISSTYLRSIHNVKFIFLNYIFYNRDSDSHPSTKEVAEVVDTLK
jgi:hypothetical protein